MTRKYKRDDESMLFDEASTELSSRRTGMSFQRTRMSADRTLMSVIRTSLSLISFGFTIYQFLGKVTGSHPAGAGAPASNFGISLVMIGVIMLVLGMIYHGRFMLELRQERARLKELGLIHGDSGFPPSMTLVTAMLLLLLGVAAVASMMFRSGPFG